MNSLSRISRANVFAGSSGLMLIYLGSHWTEQIAQALISLARDS